MRRLLLHCEFVKRTMPAHSFVPPCNNAVSNAGYLVVQGNCTLHTAVLSPGSEVLSVAA